MEILNLTNYDICIKLEEGVIQRFPAAEQGKAVAIRNALEPSPEDSLKFGVPCQRSGKFETLNLPESRPDVFYIVPFIAKVLHKDRTDLLVPHGPKEDTNEVGAILYSCLIS